MEKFANWCWISKPFARGCNLYDAIFKGSFMTKNALLLEISDGATVRILTGTLIIATKVCRKQYCLFGI
jgi:hypothetical protein